MKARSAEQKRPRLEHNPAQPSKSPGPKKSIPVVLALLENQAFCDEADHLIRELAAFAASSHTAKQRKAFVIKQTVPFVRKWGVPPPQARALVNPDSARPVAEAIMSGRWGVVPIFAWTIDPDIRAAVQRI